MNIITLTINVFLSIQAGHVVVDVVKVVVTQQLLVKLKSNKDMYGWLALEIMSKGTNYYLYYC
jgi:hypothetical protein